MKSTYGQAIHNESSIVIKEINENCKSKVDSGLECFYYLYRFIKGTDLERIVMQERKIQRMKEKIHSLLQIINEKLILC